MASRAKHVFRWDLDKTYLRTEFDTARDLLKSAFETARDKKAYPGASALLRALRQSDEHRICIISGSPTQMRRVLAAKLALDGISFDEFILKNNLRNIMRGRFRALRSQVPYKLPALLESRTRVLHAPPETLFGDDAEADAIIYSLYADILADRVSGDDLRRILEAARAYDDEIEWTLNLFRRIRRRDAVERILIHLDQRSPTARFEIFGERLVPIYNYFQAALLLYADGMLTARQVLFIALEMLEDPAIEIATLANSLQDLLRRRRLAPEIASQLAQEARAAAQTGAFTGRGHLPSFDEVAWAFAFRVRQLGELPPQPAGERAPELDYVSLVDAEYQRRRSRYGD